MSELGREQQQKLWAGRLYEDYRDILYWHRLKMRKPVIAIVDYATFWGRWCPETRTIEISRDLIRSHPWPTVLDVLRHEMAHQ